MTTPSEALPSVLAGSSVQDQEAAFALDPRINYSTITKRWQFEDSDGSEFEYDNVTGKWIPVMDDELVKAQQAAYSVQGVDEEAPAAPVLARQNKKRKEPENYTGHITIGAELDPGPSTKRNKKKNGDDKSSEKKSKNTAVYVTGLPPDTDQDELVARFQKCGVLEEDDEGDPKVKLYAKDDGTFNGEALIVYFKEESVALSVAMLDGAELRFGEPATRMDVSQAQFGHKQGGGGGRHDGNTSSKPRKTMDKKKISRRLGKMQKRLEEWDDADQFGPSREPEDDAPVINRNARVVVLKHMFTLQELEEDASMLLDLKEDVRDECSSLGEVTNVVLYDKEPEGIMTVKFRDPLSARACILKMQGRFFAGRRVEAALFTGKQSFKRTGAGEDVEGEGDEAEKKRLDDFAQWLMKEGE